MEFLDTTSNKERLIIDFYSQGFKNVILLGHYSYKEAKKELETHLHSNMLEICFLETGSQYYNVGEEHFLLRGGDFLITPPNTPHGTSGFPEEKGSLFWMIIRIPETSFKLLNLTEKDSKILINRILNLEKKHFRGSNTIKKILNEIFSIYNKRNDFLTKIEMSNLILSFLLKVIYYGEKKQNKNTSNDIEYCCKYIEKNIFEKIHLHQLAKKINLSESRFKHKFKEEIGIPPNEYIIKQKIKKAKELMQEKETSFVTLAYDLGFSNSSYFSTVFRKYEGVSPTEFKLSLNTKTS